MSIDTDCIILQYLCIVEILRCRRVNRYWSGVSGQAIAWKYATLYLHESNVFSQSTYILDRKRFTIDKIQQSLLYTQNLYISYSYKWFDVLEFIQSCSLLRTAIFRFNWRYPIDCKLMPLLQQYCKKLYHLELYDWSHSADVLFNDWAPFQLPSVQELKIEYCGFDDEDLHKLIYSFPSLTKLAFVQHTRFTSSSIHLLKDLQSLELSGNSKVIFFKEFTKLSALILRSDPLSFIHSFDNLFQAVPNIQHLELYNVHNPTQIQHFIAAFNNFRSCNIHTLCVDGYWSGSELLVSFLNCLKGKKSVKKLQLGLVNIIYPGVWVKHLILFMDVCQLEELYITTLSRSSAQSNDTLFSNIVNLLLERNKHPNLRYIKVDDKQFIL